MLRTVQAVIAAVVLMAAGAATASEIPARTEGMGPYGRLILRNVTYVDGTGSPAQGPVDIVISGDRIAEIRTIGAPGAINPNARAAPGDKEIDLTGHYVLPGFVDSHTHLHDMDDEQHVPSDYILKLWMANGVTSVRELGSKRPIEWLTAIKARSAKNEIVAPRIDVYPFFQNIEKTAPNTPEEARIAVRDAKRRGADGVKFINYVPEDVLWAALDEAKIQGLHTTMHHSQQSVAWANVLTTSAHGMQSMEHWYGLPEAMFTDKQFQKWPNDFVNNEEEERFGESGRLWAQTAPPGSPKWEAVMNTLLQRHFIIDPTFTAYLTGRDFMRMSRATWHAEYTLPSLWDYYRPSRVHHGSYWYNWTTEDEMAWKENYHLWMQFVNEYKNKGGRVAVGSDSGYIYNLYGFGYIQELELLREAGFTPLEVIHAATQVGAQTLGHEQELGTIRVGKKADLVVVDGNPLANMKLLFGTGTLRLNDATGKTEQVGGVKYTIKDGIVYDARQLRAEIRDMVAKEKAARGMPQGIMTIEEVDLTK
ncbi:amidohydrolase family protein [Caulobacter sp. S45]|jgi:cytosine/adenosine deaminase-related metal-dependent hydrolase|uniref:amidohydrolase family protein n=1 Tax=Caulobacter sp. S45 TaxID=1641861 RepID=UPI00131B65E1|nr:amidohydrolase family protein [Caulobacter sp. S45]